MKKLRLSSLIWVGIAVLSAYLAYTSFRGLGNATVLVEWSTASELDTAGFNLYRSESATGPYLQINESLIPPATDPLAGGNYSYTDEEVRAGQVYFYELEEIEMTGATSRHGPIEVQAEGGSATIGVLAAALALASLAGLVSQWRWKREDSGPEEGLRLPGPEPRPDELP